MARTLHLRFPAAGVVRRLGYRDAADLRPPFPAPWAVNVRPEDQAAKRLRGGSRPGLTKYLASAVGKSIADMVSIQVATETETKELLFVLTDAMLGIADGGTLSFPLGALTDESGNYIVTEAGDKILISTSDAPESAFLVVGTEYVYAITATAVIQFDPKTGVIGNLEASDGTVPTGCTVGAVYRDRLALAADNALYLSRQGDFTDWDYGAHVDDTGRPVILQLAEAAEIGAEATALVPHRDGAMLAATARGLWLLRGDPADDGTLANLSRFVGIVSPRAWCKVDDLVYFLANDGLYAVGFSGEGPAPVSRDVVPDDLLGLGTGEIVMGYDHDGRGLCLYTDSRETGWFYSLEGKSFWPVLHASAHAPVAVCRHKGKLLLACEDGYIREVGGDGGEGGGDDGTAITSHLLLGPVRLWSQDEFGRLNSMHGTLGADSADVTWRLVLGDTAEDAAEDAKTAVGLYDAGDADYADYVFSSGTWEAGRARIVYPRCRAMWAVLWLQSSGEWAYEGVSMQTERSGRWR
jgi:hypothetical protein